MTIATKTDASSLGTMKDLICALMKDELSAETIYANDITSLLNSAYKAGWIEQQDMLSYDTPLMRRNVARIIHMYLCLVAKEADEVDVTVSYKLRDLYDCRVCAGHVMQVYTKGIMDAFEYAPGLLMFGMKEHLSKEELKTVIVRALTPDSRLLQ